MKDVEKLGVFYLGRRYDPDAKKVSDDPILYDSRDLVTHALCVGMTGSGKTGLGIAVIEEAAIDGVPVIVIDPKGDLTNLLLTFPALRPEDFAPWVNEDDARRAGQSPSAFAAAEAARWAKGLADWGEDGARIQRLKDAAEFTIYTPGSTAGVPVSVLSSLAMPAGIDDAELMAERVQTTVSSLLALAGIEADPIKSREHILLSAILQAAWQARETLDLETLIQRIQQPPMTKIGVIDVNAFFPAADRFAFAMAINTLVAAPGFQIWRQGDPLDAAAFLRTASGKPRVSIFSIAHLDDTQRMFFVSLLLNAVTGWMRTQSGTSSLRALVYMDEIFGFFPPTANPPSKLPLLTLLKQGRAFGVGVMLATQNPVDLDYKGLANIGTWWLGRLQTERDKARVLDGLQGASDQSGLDRGELDRRLSALTSRVFLMRNVHEDGLTIFQSRWALSYLRGPLSRDDVRTLMAGRQPTHTAAAATPSPGVSATAAAGAAASSAAGGSRPVLPPGVPQYFAPSTGSVTTPLKPVLYAACDLRYTDTKVGVDITQPFTAAVEFADGPVPIDWSRATPVDWPPEALESNPPPGATFLSAPSDAANAKKYADWTKQFVTWATASQSLALLKSPSTGEVSTPGESERDFRARLDHGGREARDAAVDALRKKFAPRQAALDERARRAQQAVDREAQQSTTQNLQTAISFGATLVGAFLGRKAVNLGTLGRATTAARGVGRAMKEAGDVTRARDTVSTIEEERRQLDQELAAETAALDTSAAATESLQRVEIKPKRTGVTVKLVALVWR